MSGSDMINAHTFCTGCGNLVRPDEYHMCNFVEKFVPTRINISCVYCKNLIVVSNIDKIVCNPCEIRFHGTIPNNSRTVEHF
uniref:Uncharacterized protein n=1 Tax=Borely moumouvirus TaxID=2712067 RepID=A0A6G6ADI0_9VIRU